MEENTEYRRQVVNMFGGFLDKGIIAIVFSKDAKTKESERNYSRKCFSVAQTLHRGNPALGRA